MLAGIRDQLMRERLGLAILDDLRRLAVPIDGPTALGGGHGADGRHGEDQGLEGALAPRVRARVLAHGARDEGEVVGRHWGLAKMRSR